MRIFITVSEEPIYINPFIKRIINDLSDEIVGIGIERGKSIVVGKGVMNKFKYLLTLGVISDPWNLIKRSLISGSFILAEKTKALGWKNPYSIATVAERYNIPVTYCEDVNSGEFINFLRKNNIDVIINQTQSILVKEFIEVPKIGCINRHAALLPKYRGRLAPFWAYLNGEIETGLSIHFIDEQLDNGPIIVQKRLPIGRFDTVDSLLNKIFLNIAPDAMLEALSLIRSGEYLACLMENDPSQSSYYSAPKFIDALKYRLVMLRRIFLGK